MASMCKSEFETFDIRCRKYERINILADNRHLKYDKDIEELNNNISELRTKTVNTKEAVDNIKILLLNTGFDGFEIAEKGYNENNIMEYYLKRNNQPKQENVFKSLSEGEKNFLSFLYFHQLCLGTDDIQNKSTKKKIIVIDDPVSSLDSQSLFIVSSLIRSLIQRKVGDTKPDRQCFLNDNIAQVFVFTHNFYFYKEVSFNKRLICTDINHYLISKRENISFVESKDTIIFKDDYSNLWEVIKNTKNNQLQDQSSNILIANTMRRIIESFLNFYGYKSDAWTILEKENQNDPNYFIKCSFISMLHDESHKMIILDSIYYQRISSVHPKILFDIFEDIFKKIGKEHYELMMNL
jgi:wobble nucleotide-excising tRNase